MNQHCVYALESLRLVAVVVFTVAAIFFGNFLFHGGENSTELATSQSWSREASFFAHSASRLFAVSGAFVQAWFPSHNFVHLLLSLSSVTVFTTWQNLGFQGARILIIGFLNWALGINRPRDAVPQGNQQRELRNFVDENERWLGERVAQLMLRAFHTPARLWNRVGEEHDG
jgi:hypothetical protein